MHNLHAILFTGLILHAPCVWAATIFKCKNPQGTLLYQEKPCTAEASPVSSWALSGTVKPDIDESGLSAEPLLIGQSFNGHYFIDGAINDRFLNFVIDTGATTVAVPQAIADAAGLRCIQKVLSRTANGVTAVCTTVIQKFRFGNFLLRDIDAVIAPNLEQPLLGMNVLKRFRVEQDNGQLRLSKKY